MSARRGPIGCEIAAEVVIGTLAHPAKLRSLSLSRCFVETAATPTEGHTVTLRVPGREGRAEARAQATVERANHERVLDVGRSRGIELRLREIDAGFFSLYASQCRSGDRGGGKKPGPPPELSLLSGPAPASGTGRPERRDGPRVPSVVPLRIHGAGGESLGATRDLSRTGCFVESEDVPRLGEQLHLEFTLPDRTFRQECVVVRVVAGDAPGDAARGFAARFLPVTELLACARTQPASAASAEPLALELVDPAELAQVYLEQVKKGKLYVPTEQVFAENSVVWIELRGRDDAKHRARGRVVRCSQAPRGIGVQLLNPRSTAAWFEQCMRPAPVTR